MKARGETYVGFRAAIVAVCAEFLVGYGAAWFGMRTLKSAGRR